MTSEESLLKRFERLLEEIEELARQIDRRVQPEEARRQISEKISELEQIGIVKIAVERKIEEIMQKVKEKIESILINSSSFSTMEQDIRSLLVKMKNNIGSATPFQIIKYCVELRALNVREEDLVKTNERIMEILERFARVAEKLE